MTPLSFYSPETSCPSQPFKVYGQQNPLADEAREPHRNSECTMRYKMVSLVVPLVLAVLVSVHAPATTNGGPSSSGHPGVGPPPHAAASILRSAGQCLRFLSVYIPAQGGHYVVGVSFAYLDRNGDGHYTPGIDKLKVCVNCQDICGFDP